MPRSSAGRILVAFLLVLAVTVPCARAGEASPRSFGTKGIPSLLDLLDRAWGGLVSLWAENGCIIDPNGPCAAGQGESGSQPAVDNGCIADPNGGCRSGS